ncbi:MAG: 4Fe-4S binding protein [Polyangiaceae bacterium]
MTTPALRDLFLGLLPHRAPTGLLRVGAPGPDAPVLLTGNYTETVRRLRGALQGLDAWVLCANSKGVNVWCAAGGGHLTHHDVISVLRTSGVDQRVSHRELILPQLAATGVERRIITARTGWKVRWGPAQLDDLPAFLARGRRVHAAERTARFPLAERLRMASMWGGPMLALALPPLGLLLDLRVALAGAVCIALLVTGPFVALPWLGLRRRSTSLGLFGALGAATGALVLLALSSATLTHLVVLALTAVLFALVLSVDIAGTTPWYPSTIGEHANPVTLELVDDRCTGAADCVQVCPREVFHMNGQRRKVELVHPERCIRCAACIVQCPEDALRFRYRDGSVVEAETIRRTRVNLMGKRAVQLSS